MGGPVVSSPALSGDAFVVFGGGDGKLYALNSAGGVPPTTGTWPVPLSAPIPIRSSPAIGGDGTIYIGADDGMVYAVGTL